MINLDIYMNKTIDFMIEGKLVKVKEPSYETIQSFSRINDESGVDEIFVILAKILNDNTSNIKFKEAQLRKYPKSVINAIIKAIANEKEEAESDPN